jgi:hypothetical protein
LYKSPTAANRYKNDTPPIIYGLSLNVDAIYIGNDLTIIQIINRYVILSNIIHSFAFTLYTLNIKGLYKKMDSSIPVGAVPSLDEATSATVFTFNGVCGEGICPSSYDVDSWDIVMNLFGTTTRLKTRLFGVDGTEKRNTNLKEKALAYMAKERLDQLILNKVIKVQLGDFDKYGRVLISAVLDDGRDLASVLIEEHLVVRYDGGTKHEWGKFMDTYWPDIKPYTA